MSYPSVDLTQVKTYPIGNRSSLVNLKKFVFPEQDPPHFKNSEMVEIVQRIVDARQSGCPVIFMIGGHVVKCGLAPVLIDLMERGVITHLASNGSASIHDFEIALTGNTSEDVATSLEDGSFGMADETGSLMNIAIQQGSREGLGMGEALGRFIGEDAQFEFKKYSLLYQAYKLKVPYTIHVAIGTDIIHQHPKCDFASLGWASGQDFKIFISSVSQLEGGVFCNFGSSVIGPEVFLKSISIARNLGYPLKKITTANFDLVPLSGDYRQPVDKENPEYYYRPKKNIVIRPTSLGGRGYHITGDHRQTIPNIYRLIKELMGDRKTYTPVIPEERNITETSEIIIEFGKTAPFAVKVLQEMIKRYPELQPNVSNIVRSFRILTNCFSGGGTLFLCGNGGSFADALHITAELDKSFKIPRPLSARLRLRFVELPGGSVLADDLQLGLRAITLGSNPSLASAVENDSAHPHLNFAQELMVLGKSGDVLLGISTSGQARNVLNAALVAKAKGMQVIALTGPKDNSLQELADVTIFAPGDNTSDIQGWHEQIYHTLCDMLEQHFFRVEK
ncbi:MAG: SIS domain-containing protein [Anaerolineaceae bacterium]|nr:SIS domain-containing protein [Anaerolineaceae bacterium]